MNESREVYLHFLSSFSAGVIATHTVHVFRGARCLLLKLCSTKYCCNICTESITLVYVQHSVFWLLHCVASSMIQCHFNIRTSAFWLHCMTSTTDPSPCKISSPWTRPLTLWLLIPYSGKLSRVLIFAGFAGQTETGKIVSTKITCHLQAYYPGYEMLWCLW